jgi:Response regulator containing a CheY-like receiver domain and an HTH DNA-binding domain
MSATKNPRIVIIEPSPVVSQGIKSLLEENSTELSVIGIFCDLQAFQKSSLDLTIDFILINPAIINFYKQFNVKDLFTDYPDVIIVAIQYGYIDSETLNSFDGVLDIYDNGVRIVKKLKNFTNIYRNQQTGNSGDNIELSEREKEILVAVAKGMTNKEIADKHFISVHTVVSHRKNITRKTGIKTVSGLTIYAMFNNLISQEDLQ